jgi:hypothetical protein
MLFRHGACKLQVKIHVMPCKAPIGLWSEVCDKSVAFLGDG